MALKLRWSPTEMVLRSVDDHPGYVGVSGRNGKHTFAIDGTHEWSAETRKAAEEARDAKHAGVIVELKSGSADVEISLEEALEACEGRQEIALLVQYAVSAVQGAFTRFAPTLQLEPIQDAVSFALEVRDAAMAYLEGE